MTVLTRGTYSHFISSCFFILLAYIQKRKKFMSMILNNAFTHISIFHCGNNRKSHLSYWYFHSRYQNSSPQKNSDLCDRFFRRNYDGRRFFSFITRISRRVWIYHNNEYFYYLMNFAVILRWKGYPSKPLSYAHYWASQTSFCTNESHWRHVS